jgi:hypothetical protein
MSRNDIFLPRIFLLNQLAAEKCGAEKYASEAGG